MTAPLDVLGGVLWPDATVASGRSASPRTASPGTATAEPTAAGSDCYIAVPSLASPRYLMPADLSPPAATRLLLEYNALRAMRPRVARALLAASARLGYLPGRRRQRLTITHAAGDDALLDVVADRVELPRERLVFSCGVRVKAGVVRPILTVVDDAGQPLMFVKVARTPLHRARLLTEHAMLQQVHRLSVPGLHTPEPLLMTEWANSLVLGTSPLPGDVRAMRPGDRTRAPLALERLTTAGPRSTHTPADSPWLDAVRDRAGALVAEPRELLMTLVDLLERRWAGVVLEHGVGHGDWSFWNLAWSPSTRTTAVWDWEFGHPCAPLGIDRLHGSFATALTVQRRPLERVLRDQQLRAGSDPEARAALDLHLLEMVLRRLEDASLGDRHAGDTAALLAASLRQDGSV